jgi:small-conductance mechanosensitive channel
MGNRNRRVEIATGVPYGTNLEKTKKTGAGFLAADKRIIVDPCTIGNIKGFQSSLLISAFYSGLKTLIPGSK